MEANTIILSTTIDDLPENALVNIISFLTTLDAISSSILSRSWRNLLHQVPGLRFDIVPFHKKSSQRFSLGRASFADCIWRSLFLLPPDRRLEHFQLAFHNANFGNREIEVRSWIRSAVGRGVFELEIHFYDDPWMEANTIILPTTIDDLSENTLVNILSFLTTLDAISTSILSRSWRNLLHQVPGLRFDIVPLYKKSSQRFSLGRASFADCIWRSFFLLPPDRRLEHFQLAFHYSNFGNREIEVRSWNRSAVGRGVFKLEIHFYDDPWMEANTIILPTTIDDLPENTLVHILSFLPTLDAISTSILSRSWRNLWHQVPGLRFDIIPFYKKSSQLFSLGRASFADCIGRAFFLLPPHRRLEHFQLAFHYADSRDREIEVRSWIRSAVGRGVFKLEIHFYDDPWMEGYALILRDFDGWGPYVNMHQRFEFWFFDIINSSVKEFQLRGCDISFPSNVSAVGFESLKTLVLRDVQLTQTHQIECLMLVCANLEILNLERIENSAVNEFRILLKRLRKLILRDHYSINFNDPIVMDIDTPELVSLTVVNFGVGFSSMRINVPSLVQADFDFTSRYSGNCKLWHSFISSFQGVERLRIQNMSHFPSTIMLPTFSYLKNLELITGFAENDLLGIFAFLEASPMLELVIIDYHYYKAGCFDVNDYYYDELTLSENMNSNFVDLKIPRLVEIEMKNYRNTRNERYLVEMFKKNSVILKKIVAVPPKGIGKAPSSPIVLWEA